MANSKRKCAFCGERKKAGDMHIVGIQAFCNRDHWIENQVKQKDKLIKKGRKIEKANLRQRKEELKTVPELTKEAQKWFNKFIRLRDGRLPCVSCGRPYRDGEGGKFSMFDAGHYRSVGANPELRFNEDNCHAQCVYCNRNLSGNVANYRIGLIHRIGEKRLTAVEAYHPPRKYTRDELREITCHYKAKCKEVEKCR